MNKMNILQPKSMIPDDDYGREQWLKIDIFFVMNRVWVTDLTSGPSENLWPLRRETTRFTYLIMITKSFNLRNIYYGTTYFVVKWKIWNSLLLNLYPVLKRLHSKRVVLRRRGQRLGQSLIPVQRNPLPSVWLVTYRWHANFGRRFLLL